MAVKTTSSAWVTVAGLTLLVILGGFLRLYHLEGKSITHVEMYVPGIRLPHGISVPEERLTLLKVLTSTLNSDTHPPAYYMMMWAWTKCFGTSATSLRLPSALLGTACIPLVFWLGALTRQTAAGWIAAALMAVNGYQVFWSQVARMFTLACFLGLLATILLLRLARQSHDSRSLQLLYVMVVLVGLCTHVFFWLILAAHMLWTFLSGRNKQAMPGALKVQFLVLILGSPLLAVSAYQTGNTLARLSTSVLVYVREFLQFSFVFPLTGYSTGVYPDHGTILMVDDPHLTVSRWLFVLLSVFLFAAGTYSVAQTTSSDGELLNDAGGPSSKAWLLACGLGILAILLFIVIARAFAGPRPSSVLRSTGLMTALPLLFLLLAITVKRHWDWLASRVSIRLPVGDQALILTLAVVPFFALSIISLFKPIFNARGMLPLCPYLNLILAAGVARFSHHRAVFILMLAAVGIAHYSGLKEYAHMSAGRADYKAFAAALVPHVESTDLVFLHPEFYSTPLFFYMTSGWDRVVGRDYEVASHDPRHTRIWALWFYNYESQLPAPMEDALSSYHPVQIVQAPGGQAVLYVRNSF